MIDAAMTGRTFEVVRKVEAADCADHYANPGVTVLATPVVVALAEEAAIGVIADYLEDGQTSVGTDLRIRHTAPTPEGEEVHLLATLREIEGSRLVFDIEAADAHETVATVEHERWIVSLDRLLDRAAQKRLATD